MTPERAREPITHRVQCGSGCNRNAVRLMPAEGEHHHGQAAVERLIGELRLKKAFGLEPGTGFSRVTS